MVNACPASPARRAVFLDRDGVINRAVVRDGKPYPPATEDELELLPGVEEAICALHDAGFLIVVVTNQPDVATGVQSKAIVEAMHQKLARKLPIDEIRVCYHVDVDGCQCRKPKPGMLLDAAEAHAIDLSQSYLIGDRWRDITAGKAAGCFSFLVDYGYREHGPDSPDSRVASLQEASKIILSRFYP